MIPYDHRSMLICVFFHYIEVPMFKLEIRKENKYVWILTIL